MAKSTIPSFLNYNRSIAPSEAFLYGLSENGETPVEVIKRGVRGAISSYGNVYKGEKADSSENIAKQLDPKNANLQEIEVAFLPADAERLAIRFSVVIQANAMAPSGCNMADYYAKLTALSGRYAEIGGFSVLADRYSWNLINGRTMWRNRFASEKRVKITFDDGETMTFNTDNMRLDAFDKNAMPEGFEILSARVADALSGKSGPLFLTVEVSGKMPMGAEVFPSQEFLPDAKKAKEQGKVLSSVVNPETKVRQATMHSQKIGNAIRVIDEWHGQTDDFGATPIEAFGYVQSRSDALRVPGKAKDVYSMLKGIDDVIEALNSASDGASLDGDIHYLMAMLVRGGVFSGDKKA